MKTFQVMGYQIDVGLTFRVRKYKDVVLQIPYWADDGHIRCDKHTNNKNKFCYFKGSQIQTVDIPDGRKVDLIQITPLYARNSGKRIRNTNRTATVRVYT